MPSEYDVDMNLTPRYIILGILVVGGAFYAGRQTSPNKTIAIERTKIVECDTLGAPANTPSIGIPSNAPEMPKLKQPRADILSVQGAREDAEMLRPKFKPEQTGTKILSHREISEMTLANEARLAEFHKSDTEFGTSHKMSDPDWRRVQQLGSIGGPLKFRFDSAINSKIEISLRTKKPQAKFEVEYKKENSQSTQNLTSAFPIGNGLGLGISRDGSSYHVVFPNGVQQSDWLDYSSFGISIPFDWADHNEINVDIYGLNEELKWAVVGSGSLKRIQK